MRARRRTVVFAALIPWMLACCAGGAAVGTGTGTGTEAPPSPLVTPGPVARATPEPISAAEVVAVAEQFWPTGSVSGCRQLDCPITTRLAARMTEVINEQIAHSKTGVLGWCRCQEYSSVTITAEVTPGGGTAHVTSDTGIKMDFIMVEQGGELLVDDTQCTGRGPSTSIYAPQLVVCSG
jgi:hypothetical protein